ncbi:hypothetical protein RFI_06875 [Reticulomyxa filosa]|uniref:Uncharacterized protein n=1 Tax=Reticulomyxa filosa TaxID=46433 RepID=X6NWN3_RETFI|nr:hypothetical protein RFI_06875 [Reticulomyxa filosa]|eukprot:ETO30244.1 hypothetical protein RFI_06875 [Reticulomyxa filosa]
MTNNEQKHEQENGKWANSLDYSLLYENKTETIEIQDTWNDIKNRSKFVTLVFVEKLEQNIKCGMVNFNCFYNIPLRKLVNIFDNKEDIEN